MSAYHFLFFKKFLSFAFISVQNTQNKYWVGPKFIQVPYSLMGKKTNELFGQPNITVPISKMSKLKQRMIK